MEELTIKYNIILIWTTKPVLRVDIKLRFIMIIASCINKLCIDVWFVRIGSYLSHNIGSYLAHENLESEGAKKSKY